MLKPALRKGEYESVYAEEKWDGGEEETDRVYGDEMRSAARAKAGVVVYAREMGGEMRRVLGVE